MELLGQTVNATYMTGPRLGGSATPTFLPAISIVQPACKPYDTYPAPTPMRRALTTLPWRPSSYYGTARVDPCTPSTASMPEPNSDRNRLFDIDSFKVPPVFAAARDSLYTRYSTNDWLSAIQGGYMSSNRVRCGSERLRGESLRTCQETDDKTRKTQADVGKKLGQRINDLDYWKGEIHNEMDHMVTEIDSLHKAKCCLERVLIETQNTIHISQECLFFREKRQGIDLVNDDVEVELSKEVDNIKRLQEEMRRTIIDATNQLALNRSALHELEKDSSDKFVASNLDNICFRLRNSSRGIHYHDGIERVDNSAAAVIPQDCRRQFLETSAELWLTELCHYGLISNSVVETWARFTNNNIQKSMAERTASVAMRTRIEQLLAKAAHFMLFHWNAVNNALTDRIKVQTDARHKIQTHLSKACVLWGDTDADSSSAVANECRKAAEVLQEIFDMEKYIELLKKSIMEKETSMKVSQTRLETRSRRPNMEACRDIVQHRLVEEVYELNETVDQLKAKLRECENALQHLLRTKSSLEHDLSIKNNSIFIDRERCLGLRKSFPMSPKVACF